MRYLKYYSLFIENDKFDISENDAPDVKMSKENLNKIRQNLSEYKSKKSAIDNLYKSDKVDSVSLEKIVGSDEDKNPFLVSYANIASFNKKINNLKKKETEKAIELSNFKDRLSNASDEMKSEISDKISEIKNQINEIKNKIIEADKKLPELEKEHTEKMKKIEDDIKNWIEKIQ